MEYRIGGKTYRQQYRKCGKDGCRCHDGDLHGPYWYVIQENKPMAYFGKELPADLIQRIETLKAKDKVLQSLLSRLAADRMEVRRRERHLSDLITAVHSFSSGDLVEPDLLVELGLQDFFETLV